ncbi:hypothetical protein ACFYO1_35990 [Nocardia sp. NPDC006044]|uniref:hypothetical protein n=1 Tax=Nocardia sp. NPDC006044 TaxID=3364306 RepID=UPI0036839779
MFAVNGRWDIPLAAWLFSILLLRFSRTSRVATRVGSVWPAGVAAAMFVLWHVAVPLTATTALGGLAFGTVLTLPYLVDRLLAPRLGRVARLLLFPIHGTATLYRRTGDLFAWLCVAGMFVLIAVGIRLRPRNFHVVRADSRAPSGDQGGHGSA